MSDRAEAENALPKASRKRAWLVQPAFAGVLAALVGFASSFTVVLAGLTSVGATADQAASGLFAVTFGMAVLAVIFSLGWRLPISIAWSTPGAALLAATGVPAGGFPVAAGAFLIAACLYTLAGVYKPFARAVTSIPMPLAGAMLSGILLELCLAPLKAVGTMPALALPILVSWALTLRFARLYAMPIAVAVAVAVIVFATTIPPGALKATLPALDVVRPAFTFDALIGIALPLFIVTMASQNLPGLAVLKANGYEAPVRPVFVGTGLVSAMTAFFGGHSVNLAAITAALCAGPDAHHDPARRWVATLTCGFAYMGLALAAGFAAAFIAASPPLLIQAVAGLALLGSLAGALSSALAREQDRLPAALTFVTTASGLSFFGIGAAFWGLVFGGALMALMRFGR